MKVAKRISHQVKVINILEERKEFEVSLKVSTDLGWIDNVKFSVSNGEEVKILVLKYIKEDDGWAYFKNDEPILLKRGQWYYYYFSFEVNGQLIYYKKTSLNECITGDEYKSMNLITPEWVQGITLFV